MADFNRQAIPFPARYDYGPRPKSAYPTLAVVFHMAEGTNVAQYLSRGNVARGVSVHYTIEQRTDRWDDGELVLCLRENRISGSVNPDTLRTSDDRNGLYGASHSRDALGRWASNPNVAVISVEVAGRAKAGPTPAQVESMVQLHADIQRRYGGRVVPLGHRDFQNVKPCPGTTSAIRRAFREMGGHGKGYQAGSGGKRYMSTRGYLTNRICDVADDAPLFDYPGGERIGNIEPPLTRDHLGYSPNGRDFVLIDVQLPRQPYRTAWTRVAKVSNVRPRPEPPAGDRYDEGRDAGLDEAEAAVAALPRSTEDE